MIPKNRHRIGLSLIFIFILSQACQLTTINETELPPTATLIPIITPTKTALSGDIQSESIGDPFSPELGSAAYDVQQYIIQIKLDPGQPNYVEAEVEIQSISLQDPLSEMMLDFIGFEINHLTVDGTPADFKRSEDKLIIILPKKIPFMQSFIVQISYAGEAVQRPSRFVTFEDSIGLIYPDSESIMIASEPDGARFWFPCNDHPRDKALYRIEVTIPSKYLAASNGRLIKSEDLPNDTTRFIWEHNYPMASYLATIVVGEYERYEAMTPNGILIRDYIFPESKEAAFDAFAQTPEMLSWLESLLGPYPYDTFGHATVKSVGFSLETQSLVLMSTRMLNKEVVIHEMVHMWFGDWVSLNSWGEMWRNEGFATYFSWYWFYRDDLDGFNKEMELLTREVLNTANLEPLGNLSANNLFSYETYIKGGVMVHALRQEVGEEAFFSGLKLYFERFGGGTASDEDFQNVMEEISGMNLDAFFNTWLTIHIPDIN